MKPNLRAYSISSRHYNDHATVIKLGSACSSTHLILKSNTWGVYVNFCDRKYSQPSIESVQPRSWASLQDVEGIANFLASLHTERILQVEFELSNKFCVAENINDYIWLKTENMSKSDENEVTHAAGDHNHL